MIRKLKEEDVMFSINASVSHAPIVGNCSAIDEETDKATEDFIVKELVAGNEWAWCDVVVVAEWNGHTGYDSLGACSYRNEEDFKAPGGYYNDMKAEALDQLNIAVVDAYEELKGLEL